MECAAPTTPASAPPASDGHEPEPGELEKRIATLRQAIATLNKQLEGLRDRLHDSPAER